MANRALAVGFSVYYLSLWGFSLFPVGCAADAPVTEVQVGSKVFAESLILGELVALLVKQVGAEPVRRLGLGGTQVVWHALRKGDVDVYADYTGTISKEILASSGPQTDTAIREALARRGVVMSRPLGFNNGYAIGMKKPLADQLGIRRISDLRDHPDLKLGFTSEFLDRADGWPGLKARYNLPQRDVRGLEHALAYASLNAGSIQATDLYSTDAKIRAYDLQLLDDDLHYFPAYEAVLLYRADLAERAPAALASLLRLEGRISEADMVAMNARVELDKVPESQVAADFLTHRLGIAVASQTTTVVERLMRLTRQHVLLVAVSLIAAILVAVPLGIVAARRPRLGQPILALAATIQTIPSIALLTLMIPLLGIGAAPAVAALFLYSLLPIVRNTHAGLHEIPLSIRESAEALGLPPRARLRLVELPMAARTILAGIKTAAVINVGTATLGGFIGAGGYGEVIFTGLYKLDEGLILQGAIPTALLALLVQGLFELAERWLVPRGLRLQPE